MIYRAIIFDRDGVLIKNYGYVYKKNKLKWLKGAIDAIRYLNKKKIKVFVATNQSGISRGYFSLSQLSQFHSHMRKELKKKGAKINKIYFCPHHKEGTVKIYKKICHCRKPDNGMILNILKENKLKKKEVCMIGDQETDFKAAIKTKINFFYKKKTSLFLQIKNIT